jgi:hypothetical protein
LTYAIAGLPKIEAKNRLEASRVMLRNQMMVPVLLEISTVSDLASVAYINAHDNNCDCLSNKDLPFARTRVID